MTNGKKTVVITGASTGIGRSCVLRMMRAGWQVFATVRKAADRERFLMDGITGVTPVMMDVENHSSIAAAGEHVAARLSGSGLDGLVNVAGIGMMRPVEYATQRDMREIFEVNVFGQIAVTQAFLPVLRQSRGRIVNITSVGVNIAIPFGGLLNGSKAAFALMSDSMRMELRPFGVRVCAVEPGAIFTPAVDKTLGDVEGVISNLPVRGQAQYASMLRNFASQAYKREKSGSSPDVVAEAVHQALTSARPRTRYRVGKDAKLLTMLSRALPERLLDALRYRIFHIPRAIGDSRSTEHENSDRFAVR